MCVHAHNLIIYSFICNRFKTCVSVTKVSGFETDSLRMRGKERTAFLLALSGHFLADNTMLKPLPERILHYVKEI